ncbi:MAG: hypothetical protein HYS26_02315 [Candidatus Kaiserbacteria bacterium]|nr:MAG: hypothetical protein HYS26_02315 [Candidatus Kaiserbacteria bacterium]
MKKGTLIFSLAVLALLVAGIGVAFTVRARPGDLDSFATCLKDRGAVFYGAFWCPHCKRTKDLFGASAKLLPYVECSTPDGQTQLDACKEKGIDQYPTWIFADGSRLTGERTLEELSEKTSCALPQS